MPLLVPDTRPYSERFAELGANMDAQVAQLQTTTDALTAKVAELQAQIPATLTATAARDTADPTTVHVTWQPVDGSYGYVVGRDGTDTHNHGPIYFLDPAGRSGRDLIWLTADPITVTVIAVPSGIQATLTA